jgi:hypothetical protein
MAAMTFFMEEMRNMINFIFWHYYMQTNWLQCGKLLLTYRKFIRSFEKVTQQFVLTINIKKTCLMSLKQLKEDHYRKVLKGQNVNYTDLDINIRNQKLETADSFTYFG